MARSVCIVSPGDLAANAVRLGRECYNWHVEKKALLTSVDAAFAEAPCRR